MGLACVWWLPNHSCFMGFAGTNARSVSMQLEPSTRSGLQQANALVSSLVFARALGALTGFGAPLLTSASLIWGIFSALQIDAAATGDSKTTGGPAGDPKPACDGIQTAQNKPPDALN